MRAFIALLVINGFALSLFTTDIHAETDPVPGQAMDAAYLQQLKVLDLETAQRFALANSPNLAAAAERVNQASERVNQARATYFPTLDAEGSATRVDLSNNEEDDLQDQFGQLNPNARVENPENYYRAGLVGSWIVFDGFRREFSNALADYGEEASQASLTESRRLLLSAVADSYYQAQLQRKNIAIADADEAFQKRQAEEARARYRVGTGSLSDVLNFEVQVNVARSARNDFSRAYEIARVGLAELMGVADAYLPPDLDLAGLAKETEMEMTPPDPEVHIDYALVHRSDIQQSEAILKQTGAGVGIARSRFYPSLQLAGTVEAETDNSPNFESDDFGNTVGLYLTYRLYSGGERRARLAEAKFQEREATENLRSTTIRVAADVRDAIANVKSAQYELELQRKNAELVTENRDLVDKEYKAGQASLVRLNEAQRDMIQAQGRLALARVGLLQTLKNLDTSTGAILEPFNNP